MSMTKLVLIWTDWKGTQHDATWTFRNDPPSAEEYAEALEHLKLARERMERHDQQSR